MKTMGRLLAFAVAMSLALVFAGCGGSASQSASSASASGSASSASSSAESADTSTASADFEKGTTTSDTYTNTFFGVKYTLPIGYAFYSDDQLAQQNGGTLDDKQVVEALKSGMEYFDAAAALNGGYPTVSMSVVYAGTPEAKALDANGFAKYVAAQSDGQAGIYQNGQSGEEFAAVKRNVAVNGQNYAQEIIVTKSGDYFMMVTATSTDESALDDVLCNFATVK